MLVPLNHRKRDLKSWCIRVACSWKPLYSFAGLDCHKKCQRLGGLHYGNLFSQFWRLKSKVKAPADLVPSENPVWVVGRLSSCCNLTWQSGKGSLCEVSFRRALIPSMRASPLPWANHLPKAHLPITSGWMLAFQHELGGMGHSILAENNFFL